MKGTDFLTIALYLPDLSASIDSDREWCQIDVLLPGKKWVPHKGERGPKRRKELQWFSDCLGSGNLVLAREKKIVEGNTSSAEWYMIVSRETEELVAGFQAGIRSRESNKTIRYKAMFARL